MGEDRPMASHYDILAAAKQIEIALDQRAAQQREDLLEAAVACEGVFALRASEIRNEAASRLLLGIPPSLRQLVGISHLEVPMNQVLGWMLNPEYRGAAAFMGLGALAKLLDYPALEADIERRSNVAVWCESTPDYEITSRQPDLLIGTKNTVVLIENKVYSPESGFDQYSHYLEVARAWAGERESRAYLLAPNKRATPCGWDGSLTHAQLGEALRRLVVEPGLSFWDRVIYGLIVSDLDPDPMPNRAREIEHLVEADALFSDVEVATRLSQLLRRQAIDPTNGRY